MYVLALSSSLNFSSNCQHLGGGPDHTMELCEFNTTLYGGNVFNWNNGTCFYKNCMELELKFRNSQFEGSFESSFNNKPSCKINASILQLMSQVGPNFPFAHTHKPSKLGFWLADLHVWHFWNILKTVLKHPWQSFTVVDNRWHLDICTFTHLDIARDAVRDSAPNRGGELRRVENALRTVWRLEESWRRSWRMTLWYFGSDVFLILILILLNASGP